MTNYHDFDDPLHDQREEWREWRELAPEEQYDERDAMGDDGVCESCGPFSNPNCFVECVCACHDEVSSP